MFNVGEELSSRELAERLGVTFKSWENKRKKYLEHLNKFYKIELKGYGVTRKYVIVEQLQEYESMISPRDRVAMENKYKEVILDEISKPNMNFQNYTSMNKRVIATGKTAKFGHKERTSYKYTTLGMKEMFGAEENSWGTHGKCLPKVWCRRVLDQDYDFEPLEGEILEDWLKFLKEALHDNTSIAETYSDYFANELSENEAMALVWADGKIKYQYAVQQFSDKYGFEPIKIREYMVGPEEAKLHVDTCGFVD